MLREKQLYSFLYDKLSVDTGIGLSGTIVTETIIQVINTVGIGIGLSGTFVTGTIIQVINNVGTGIGLHVHS